jgi:hypothetical protein
MQVGNIHTTFKPRHMQKSSYHNCEQQEKPMIRKYLIIAASALAFQSSYAAQESTTKAAQNSEKHFGPTFIENKRLDTLTVFGPATLEHITVTGGTDIMGPAKIKESTLSNIKISGPLDARKINISSLEATGPVKLERVSVDGKTKIYGPLNAEESKFTDTITIATDKMTLDHTTAQNIEVQKNSNWLEKPQKVYLTNKTVVNGNISFEAGNGIVIVKKGATLKGEVKGGKKIEKDTDKN